MEANVGGSLAEMLTTRTVLLVGGLKVAFRPVIFTLHDFNEMDATLIGFELT